MDWTPPASLSTQKSDVVFYYTLGLAVLFLVFITGLMIYFVVRYSRKRHPKAAQIEGHLGLEITWTVVPLVLFLVIFWYGWTNYEFMRNPPRDAMVVKVAARQWAWSFEYPNGKQTPVLYAPMGRPVKLELRTLDVIHGFYIPAFRLKMDVVPGLVNTTWFEATRLGAYDVECTVICGVDHSQMLSKVVVVPEPAFKAWYFGGDEAKEPEPVALATVSPTVEPLGLTLMRAKGCLSCHSVGGEPMAGPTFKGLYGRREQVLVHGRPRTITLDERNLRRAILTPGAAIVQGYPPAMPAIPMTPQELAEIIGYLRELQ